MISRCTKSVAAFRSFLAARIALRPSAVVSRSAAGFRRAASIIMISSRAPRLSLRSKVTLAMASVAGLVVAAILATNFHFRRAQLLEEFQTFVAGVAGTTALALNGDEINSIHT